MPTAAYDFAGTKQGTLPLAGIRVLDEVVQFMADQTVTGRGGLTEARR